MKILGKASLLLLALVFITGAFLSACGAPAPAPAPTPAPAPSPTPAPAPKPTPTPTPSPTPAPKPAPTPTPTPAPSPTPAPAQPTALFLDIVSISPTSPGGPMRVEVKTLPGAKVSFFSTLPGTGTISQYPPDKVDKPADANGKIVWEWTITAQARKGEGTMEFTAVLGDQTVKKSAKYTLS